MKKVLFLLSMFIAVGSAMFAQLVPTPPETNVYLSRSFPDKLADMVPYNSGVMYYSHGQFTDAVGTITDGETVTVIETLQANTISKLSTWAGDSKAYYYGDADNSFGTELRVFNGSSATMLRNAGHGIYPALTNVERMEYSNGKVVYYYMTLGNYSQTGGGYEAIVNETDGTHFGTSSISVQDDQIIRHTGISEGGVFSGFADGDIFNFIAAVPGSLGNYSALLEVEDGDAGSSAKYLFDNGSEAAIMDEVFAYEDYYLISESQDIAPLTTVDRSNYNNIASVPNFKFFTKTFVRANDKVFGVGGPDDSTNPRNFRKLIVVENKAGKIISLNNVNITDNVENLTLSGNKLYFSATNANGENGLYAIDVTIDNPEIILVDELYSSEITAITAVDGGVAYASFNSMLNSSSITISNGFSDADYGLYRGMENGMFEFGYIEALSYNNGFLYISENNANGGTDVWHHEVSEDSFATANTEVTVTDAKSSDIIEGATLSIFNSFNTYTATSDANGVCSFSDIEPGVYSYSVSAQDYLTNAVNVSSYTNYPIWINEGDNTNSVKMYAEGNMKDFNFVIEDASTGDIIMGADKLGNATVTLVSGPYTYTAISDDETSFDHGFARFTDVNYGLYEYEVVCDGYTSYNGFFNVNENTLEGETVSLIPTATLSFLSELSWSTPEYPYAGGVHVLLESMTDPDIVFYTPTNNSTDEEREPKAYIYDVPHGEYIVNYTHYMHIPIVDTITVDGDQDFIISMDEAKGDFIFNVTGNDVNLANALIRVYDIGAVHATDSATTDANGAATLSDLYFGTYIYEITADGFTTEIGEFDWDEKYENWPNSILNVSLYAPGSIDVLIHAANQDGSSSALAGATVSIINTEDSEITFTGVTSADGSYNFPEVPFGTYDYSVSATGYFTVSGQYVLDINTTEGIEETLNPEVNSFYAVVKEEGSIIDGGINGATVTLISTVNPSISYSGITDGVGIDAGNFLFEDVLYGTYSYEIVADGYVSVSGTHIVGDADGGIMAYLKPASGDITVSVLDNDLVELGGALITLTDSEDANNMYTGTTDDLGSYTFTNIPFATYNYEVSKEDYATATDSYVFDENATEGIEVVMSMASIDLLITVENSSQESVADATVNLVSTDDSDISYTATTDNSGMVEFTDVPFGSYNYSVSATNYEPKDESLDIDADTEAELTIVIDYRVGIDETEMNLSIYPNPAVDVVRISSSTPIASVIIYDITGQKVKEIVSEHLTDINIAELASGIYLFKVLDINGSTQLTKVNKL